MSGIGTTHLLLSITAILAGAVVALLPKGSRTHARWGLLYAWSMIGVNATALAIYRLFGRFGPFHWAALFALAALVVGWLPAVRRRPRGRWVRRHAWWMAGSYVGLLAAAVSETATRFLDLPFGATVVVASVVTIALGVAVMFWRVPRAVAPFVPRR